MNSSISNKTGQKTMRGALYTKMKIFHFKENLDSLPQDVKAIKAPIHIRIKPTNVCNHNCYYCAYRVDGLQLGKDMINKDYIPKDKMLEIIDDISGMGVKAVTFSGGGDPFCYPYLLDAVKALINTPVKFAALTNAGRLNGELAELFANHAVWLRVSIDGWDDESYSEYRRVPIGEFTKVIDNMKHFKKFGGKCYLGVSLIVDRKNAAHIYDFIKRLRDIGVDSVKVSACITSNKGAENNLYHLPIFEQVKKEIGKAKTDFENDAFEINDSYHRLDDKFKKDYNWCPYLQMLPVIGADLNVYSCQDKAYNLDEGLVGTIRDVRFKDFWFSDKNKFFKINPSAHCNHHCVANEKNKVVFEYFKVDKEHLDFI